MFNCLQYILLDNLKNRFVIGYLTLLLAASTGLLFLSQDADKGILGISNIVLLMVPLVSSIYSGISLYNSADFTRLLLTQPLTRMQIFFANFLAVGLTMVTVFVIGIGIPMIVFSSGEKVFTILITGIALSMIFPALSTLVCLSVTDKVRGIGAVLFLWLYFAVVYDGILLFFIRMMSDYPIERYALLLTLLNPVDLCRILIMFSMDISALMGLTGVVLQEFMGTGLGKTVIYLTLFLWLFLPTLFAARLFFKKDF